MINTKYMFSFLVFVMLQACMHADRGIVIEGLVVSEDGKPIPNQKIDISGWPLHTDDNGYFCYDHLHPKKNVRVSVISSQHKKLEAVLAYGSYDLKINFVENMSATSSKINSQLLPSNVNDDLYCTKQRKKFIKIDRVRSIGSVSIDFKFFLFK
jgi:hypothetical protein